MTIREIREYKEISLREMAWRLSISASHLSDIEKGKKTPSAALYDRMIREYGESIKDWYEVVTVRQIRLKMF